MNHVFILMKTKSINSIKKGKWWKNKSWLLMILKKIVIRISLPSKIYSEEKVLPTRSKNSQIYFIVSIIPFKFKHQLQEQWTEVQWLNSINFSILLMYWNKVNLPAFPEKSIILTLNMRISKLKINRKSNAFKKILKKDVIQFNFKTVHFL